MMNTHITRRLYAPTLLKKMGVYSFAFFLVKGLLWLVVAGAAYWLS